MVTEEKTIQPVPVSGPGFQRMIAEIDRYGRRNVAAHAGLSYQTVCNYIWSQPTSLTTRSDIAKGLFAAAKADLLKKKGELLEGVETLQSLVDAIREELGEDFLKELQTNELPTVKVQELSSQE
ncbi:hypothetical protein GCM10028803_00030 [Larkinella knui]|uniref:Uncharacterized protein n=1 Tax=Larkinella knui TaxID=2025310 RepID=A0A3P1CJ92_9BACT|nr:hypothetical protein [Larkinella knui]RRB13412.1 hypothetical protein EHT87_14140 [Larkinella knui]